MVTETYPSLRRTVLADPPGPRDLPRVRPRPRALRDPGCSPRLIKRRTRGLEPAEIGALADQREALLHSIREGVVAVGEDGTVTVLSDSARDLLGLPDGSRVAGSRTSTWRRGCATRWMGDSDVHDAVLVVAGRVVVLNRNRVLHDGRQVGTVTTLRDRTELLAMQSELSARESVTETLRAQTHEFSNQLHTISGLVQLEEYDEVSRVIGTLTRRRAEISDFVTARVDDPAVAALLIAKTSLAAERGIDLAPVRRRPAAASGPGALGRRRHRARQPRRQRGRRHGRRWRNAGSTSTSRIEADGTVLVRVADTRPRRARAAGRRDLPSRLVDQAQRRQSVGVSGWRWCRWSASVAGGSVSVHNEGGAVFTARLPNPRGRRMTADSPT